MGFLNSLFGSKEKSVHTNSDFWEWFCANQSGFRKLVMTKDSRVIEEKFFSRLGPKLNELREGVFFLTGMLDDSTVDLVLTADGNPKNIAFVEELVADAPELTGWQFTPLKQPMGFGFGLAMHGLTFGDETLSFYPVNHLEEPDLVEIVFVHRDLNESNEQAVRGGTFILLENVLGELNFLENIDEIRFQAPTDAEKDLIPIDALENYLQTRQALFVEKYDGVRIFTESDSYSIMEAEIEGGRRLVATINTDLLKWDRKASHPWILVVKINYDGGNNNGLPDNETAEKLNEIEQAISDQLRDADGYLNIGRQAANNERLIFYGCVDFRQPSKVAYNVKRSFETEISLDYEIYKDKYWRSVSHLSPPSESL